MRKQKQLKALIKGVIEDKIDVPDNALVFLNYEDLRKVFTKKRLELLQLINDSNPKSLQELVVQSKRLKQAITRDLKILERQEVISLEKKGRIVIPKIRKRLIMFPVVDLSSKELREEEPIKAKVYVDGQPLHKLMAVNT